MDNAKKYGLGVFKKSFTKFITSTDGSKKAGKFGDVLDMLLERKLDQAKKDEIAAAVAKAAPATARGGILGLFI